MNFFELAFSINSEYFNNVNFSRLITWKFYDAKFFQVYNSEIVLFFFFQVIKAEKVCALNLPELLTRCYLKRKKSFELLTRSLIS